MRKIAVFTATRAEYGLLRPLLFRLQESDTIQLQIIVSGTHLSHAHGYTLHEIEKDGFMPTAYVELNFSCEDTKSLCSIAGEALSCMGHTLTQLNPDMLVLLGDRYECLAAATAATLCSIPIVHIHGGEITEGAIDDCFRHAITKMAHLHFTSCDGYRKRVIQLGEQPERVWNVGALGVENALHLPLLSRDEVYTFLGLPQNTPYFLCTFHPVTLEAGEEESQLQEVINALDQFPEYYVIFTGANADLGGNAINKLLHQYQTAQPQRVQVHQSLGVLRYLSAAKYASCVVGNSSSGILEIPSLATPVVNIGDRQKGRIASDAVLHCPPLSSDIAEKFRQSLTPEHKKVAATVSNPYNKTGTSMAICKILQSYPLQGILKKSFYNI